MGFFFLIQGFTVVLSSWMRILPHSFEVEGTLSIYGLFSQALSQIHGETAK